MDVRRRYLQKVSELDDRADFMQGNLGSRGLLSPQVGENLGGSEDGVEEGGCGDLLISFSGTVHVRADYPLPWV